MKFLTSRDLRNTPGAVWKALAEHETVALMGEGGPRALLLEVENGDVELALDVLRRARGLVALERLRRQAAARGLMTEAEIEAEVRAERAGRAGERSRARGRTRSRKR